jgi:hypothetical protein
MFATAGKRFLAAATFTGLLCVGLAAGAAAQATIPDFC